MFYALERKAERTIIFYTKTTENRPNDKPLDRRFENDFYIGENTDRGMLLKVNLYEFHLALLSNITHSLTDCSTNLFTKLRQACRLILCRPWSFKDGIYSYCTV